MKHKILNDFWPYLSLVRTDKDRTNTHGIFKRHYISCCSIEILEFPISFFKRRILIEFIFFFNFHPFTYTPHPIHIQKSLLLMMSGPMIWGLEVRPTVSQSAVFVVHHIFKVNTNTNPISNFNFLVDFECWLVRPTFSP